MHSRRAALASLVGITASAAVSPLAQHEAHDAADTVSGAQPHDPVFFSKADYAIVSCLADLIIPRTSTPGAIDANVPYRIDHQVSAITELQATFQEGLAFVAEEARKMGAADFNALSQTQQTSLLTSMSEAPDTVGGRFFRKIKDLTIDWYYRSEEGLVTELGFHGNTFRPNFPGCTHPEHWPAMNATKESA